MTTWKDKLTTAEAQFVQDVVDQIPTTMGARDMFEGLLNKLANGGGGAKFAYFVVKDDDVVGTNDLAKARHLAQDDSNYVIDVSKNLFLQPDDKDDIANGDAEVGDDDSNIPELRG